MAKIKGTTGVGATIAPASDTSKFAATSEQWHKGGYKSFANEAERDAMMESYKKEGMLIRLNDSKRFQVLENGEWQDLSFSGESGEIDLSNCATKDEINQANSDIDELLDTLNTKADKSEVNELKEQISGGAAPKSYDKFVVVGVWGQSNAVGYDEGEVNAFDVAVNENRIFQISAIDNEKKPLTYCAENLQNMNTVIPQGYVANGMSPKAQAGTKGIHLPLANLICSAIPDDYGVIMVPYAYGGQQISYFLDANRINGFTDNIKKALDLNEKNIFAGIIWCQGENNSGNTNGATYKTSFENLVNSVNDKLSAYANRTSGGAISAKSWYFYEYPLHYRNQTYGREIMNAIKEVVGEKNYVALREDHPVNITKYTSSNMAAHYAGDFYRTDIAPKVFKAMCNNGVFFANSRDEIGASGAADIDTSSFVSFEVYDELNKRFSLTEKMLAQYEKSIKALGGTIDKKVQVTSDLLTGFGEFDATQTGITYVGELGSSTFEKYTPEGYDAFYFDNNLNASSTYGVVVAINKTNGKYLWIYSNDNKVLTNTSVAGGTTFATTPVGATGSKNIIQGNYKIKVVRNGNVFELWRKGINDGDDVEYTKQHQVDITNALDTIGGAENTSYVWGFCVGWSKTLTKVNSDANHWDNVFVEQL